MTCALQPVCMTFQMLLYIGETSPECELYHGEPLNLPFRAPEELPGTAEKRFSQGLLEERSAECEHVTQHIQDVE